MNYIDKKDFKVINIELQTKNMRYCGDIEFLYKKILKELEKNKNIKYICLVDQSEGPINKVKLVFLDIIIKTLRKHTEAYLGFKINEIDFENKNILSDIKKTKLDFLFIKDLKSDCNEDIKIITYKDNKGYKILC